MGRSDLDRDFSDFNTSDDFSFIEASPVELVAGVYSVITITRVKKVA